MFTVLSSSDSMFIIVLMISKPPSSELSTTPIKWFFSTEWAYVIWVVMDSSTFYLPHSDESVRSRSGWKWGIWASHLSQWKSSRGCLVPRQRTSLLWSNVRADSESLKDLAWMGLTYSSSLHLSTSSHWTLATFGSGYTRQVSRTCAWYDSPGSWASLQPVLCQCEDPNLRFPHKICRTNRTFHLLLSLIL